MKFFSLFFILTSLSFSLTKNQIPDNTSSTNEQIEVYKKIYDTYTKIIKIHSSNILVHTQIKTLLNNQNRIESTK